MQLFFSFMVKGAFFGLLLGELFGCTWMVLDFLFQGPPCGDEDIRPIALQKIHYLHFAILNYTATTLMILLISLMTKRIPREKVNINIDGIFYIYFIFIFIYFLRCAGVAR